MSNAQQNNATVKKLIKLTVEEIKNNDAKSYNESVWVRKIDTLVSAVKDVQFYMLPKDDVYAYDRFFASYTIPEGIRLFNSFDYSSMLSNAAFNWITIDENGAFEMFKLGMPNTDKGRELMVDLCKQDARMIFTTESI
jgi:hypothetical protein